MPIEVGIWKLGQKPERINMTSIDTEARLEQMLVRDISMLSPKLMLIGQQIPTPYGKFIDLLAIDADGNLSVIELKRNRTPREVVAQILDYASWAQRLSYKEIADIYAAKNPGKEFETGFADAFGANPPEELNQRHELVIVASELDPATERILGYLSDNYSVPINVVFFRYFKLGNEECLARTWLIDPQEVEAKADRSSVRKGGAEPWNGRDYYVAVGEGDHRNWDDCRVYGFVSAGGSRLYGQQMRVLKPGNRIFAYIPQVGYVGVGVVREESVPVKEFTIEVDGEPYPLLHQPLQAPKMAEHAEDPDRTECLVRVEWIKAVPREQGFKEKGLFANQNAACKLRNRFTLERLTEHFKLED